MIMSLKQRQINFKPRIKLSHNIYTFTANGDGSGTGDNLKGPSQVHTNNKLTERWKIKNTSLPQVTSN